VYTRHQAIGLAMSMLSAVHGTAANHSRFSRMFPGLAIVWVSYYIFDCEA